MRIKTITKESDVQITFTPAEVAWLQEVIGFLLDLKCLNEQAIAECNRLLDVLKVVKPEGLPIVPTTAALEATDIRII